MREIMHQQTLPNANFVSVASQHGVMWQAIAMEHVGDTLEAYPLASVRRLCGRQIFSDLGEYYNEHLNTDTARECRHAVGHAVFYTIALCEQGLSAGNICSQFRPGSYTLRAPQYAAARRVCFSAPTLQLRKDCINGLDHSYNLLRTSECPERVTYDCFWEEQLD